VRFGARDYDPRTGRWTAKEPRGVAADYPNMFLYALADPVNYQDLDGRAVVHVSISIGWPVGGQSIGVAIDDNLNIALTTATDAGFGAGSSVSIRPNFTAAIDYSLGDTVDTLAGWSVGQELSFRAAGSVRDYGVRFSSNSDGDLSFGLCFGLEVPDKNRILLPEGSYKTGAQFGRILARRSLQPGPPQIPPPGFPWNYLFPETPGGWLKALGVPSSVVDPGGWL
jgi:hypothetical protein